MLICRSCANPTARHPSRVRLGRHLSPSSLSLLHRQRRRSSQSRHDPTQTHNRKCAENPKHVTKSKNRTQKTPRNRHPSSAIAICNFVLPLLPTFHGLESSHLRLFSHRPSLIAHCSSTIAAPKSPESELYQHAIPHGLQIRGLTAWISRTLHTPPTFALIYRIPLVLVCSCHSYQSTPVQSQ
jgi:hypothetical protein